MPLPKDQAWFAAKRYGYGWGLPKRWQGWFVLLGYILALLAVGLSTARSRPVAFAVWCVVASALLILICAWKGESPKWRWGDDDDDKPKA